MPPSTSISPATTGARSRRHNFLPILQWGRGYRRADFIGDLLAGVVVAIMLVPQSMAYALLAGQAIWAVIHWCGL